MAKKNSTAQDARLAARKQAQQQVKAQERRTSIFIVIGVAVALALFGGIVYFIVQQSSVPALDSPEMVAPLGADNTGGILIGQDGAAGGEVPEDATRVDVYQDFMCPYCGMFEMTNGEDLEELVGAGEIALYVHPLALLDRSSQGTNFSTRSANALAAVADGAPEHVLEFSRLMYVNQPEQGTPGLSDDDIEELAIQAGVPQDVASTLADGKFTKWVIAATDQSSKDGVPGTPAVMVDRTMLAQQEVPYMQPDVLRAYLEGQ